jgi:ABC-type cobalamin/Fe3+-siderophores transport system ATPase subunit
MRHYEENCDETWETVKDEHGDDEFVVVVVMLDVNLLVPYCHGVARVGELAYH